MTDDNELPFLDQPRDDNGRFASKNEPPAVETISPPPAPSIPPATEPAVAPPEQPAQTTSVEPSTVKATPPDGYIPIAAVLDEREKRQELKRELEEFKRKYAEREQQPQTPPPDPIVDPEGFQRALDERIAQTQWDATTRISLRFAVQQHGAEAVKAAEDWVAEQVQSNPAFINAIRQQPDPYDFVVRQHKRHVALSKFGDDDPDAYARKWAEANGYVLANPQQQPVASVGAPSPQSTPLPRPSIASAPSASSGTPKIPTGGGVAFDEVFRK